MGIIVYQVQGKESNMKLSLNYERNQQDATKQVNLLFLVGSTCFRQCFRPLSGALDCI